MGTVISLFQAARARAVSCPAIPEIDFDEIARLNAAGIAVEFNWLGDRMSAIHYRGTREALLRASVCIEEQFPAPGRPYLSKYFGYPAGKAHDQGGGMEWTVRRERGGEFLLIKYLR